MDVNMGGRTFVIKRNSRNVYICDMETHFFSNQLEYFTMIAFTPSWTSATDSILRYIGKDGVFYAHDRAHCWSAPLSRQGIISWATREISSLARRW
jgi:hypothetical protein